MIVKRPPRDRKKAPLGDARPLCLADFAFYGFDDLRRFRGVEDVGIRSGEPKLSVYENCVAIPSTMKLKGWPAHVGGVVDLVGEPVEQANVRRWGSVVFAGLAGPAAVDVEHELDEEVIYLGWLLNQFGHLLLESLARAWFLREVAPSVRVLFHVAGRKPEPGGIMSQILSAFGIPLERILTVDKPTRVRRLLVPEPLYELGYVAHERAADAHRAAAAQVLGTENYVSSLQPVYLSRRLLPSDRRAVVGEAELEMILQENGFRIAHPQLMTFAEQVQMINEHANIVACEGSAAHGVLLALDAPRLHLLVSTAASPDYFLTSTIAGASMSIVRGLVEKEDRAPDRSFPHLADIPRVVEYLEEQGLLPSRSGMNIAASHQSIHDRYNVAWFVRLVRMSSADKPLSVEHDREANQLAATSWPLTWMLLRYYAQQDPLVLDRLVDQFIVLLAKERDEDQLAHYRREIRLDAPTVLQHVQESCETQLAARLANALGSRELWKPRASRSTLTILEGDAMLIVSLNRVELLSLLPKGGQVAEVGTFRGAFAKQILRLVCPDVLHLIDPWEKGERPNPQYANQTLIDAHDEVRATFRDDIAIGRVVLHQDYSTNVAATIPDQSLDRIYIDGLHDYESVQADLLAFKAKVKPDGFVLGHDFSNYRNPKLFGVIPAVRKFVAEEDFDLVLLTNEPNSTYLLARSDNCTTLPILREALLNHRSCSIVEVDESLLDRFEQVDVVRNGQRTRIMRFGGC